MARKKKTSTVVPDTSSKSELPSSPEAPQETPFGTPPEIAAELKSPENSYSFPIVGIGASAGGLEALEAFFTHMPSDSGIAFVLVQHLDPTHESILVEILKRYTQMKVSQVESGISIAPNCIYVIPPNYDMALMRGKLFLIEPLERRGFRLPIDYFFRSLAENLMELAIGIILSGTGSDGTMGLKEIRGVGGMTMAQTPESAQYDGMPRSAIDSGIVDYILAPDEMPDRLLHYQQHFFQRDTHLATSDLPQETDANSLAKIFVLLRRRTKHDFSLYKRNTIARRIERRMVVTKTEGYADYLDVLRKNPLEIKLLFQELLIGVTSFFRDPAAFEALEYGAIAKILENRQPDQPVRVWVPGCSTGEEAYSIAIMLQEQMTKRDLDLRVQIFATDIDDQSIEKARKGIYPANIASEIAPERLQRFFAKENNTYHVSKQIREMIVFAIQNVTTDPPFSNLDLISCRNLLIYLEPDLQKKVISLFHYGLIQGGYLFLGTSEGVGQFIDHFRAVDRTWKLFQRVTGKALFHNILDFYFPLLNSDSVSPIPEKLDKQPVNIRDLTEKALLQDFTPPCVIINEQSQIVYFHGKMASYLEPSSGEASLNIIHMVREDLRASVNMAIRRAFARKDEVVRETIHLQTGDKHQTINLVVKPLSSQPLYMVIFEDIPSAGKSVISDGGTATLPTPISQIQQLERKLQSTKEYLQTTIEELETTNEEVKSTNEELQSANEELQSTNEEMETSKEELQSVNEELGILNSELRSKIEELVHTNNDLNNLLVNVDIGIVFLDSHLNILRFNLSATQLINLIETDIGRPIAHIVSNLVYDGLGNDARNVLNTLIPLEREVHTPDERWFLMRIRPYRTVENAIVGLVLTFAEITSQKLVQKQLMMAREFAQNIVATIREPLIVLNGAFEIVSASRSFYQTFVTSPELIAGKSIFEIDKQQWDIPQLRNLLEKVLPENRSFENYQITAHFPRIGQQTLVLNAQQISNMDGKPEHILLAFEKITLTEIK